MFTDAGTLSGPAVDISATLLPPGPESLDAVTVQVLLAFGAIDPGAHWNAVTTTGAIRETAVLADPPFAEAVICATPSTSTAAPATVNCADVEPAGTVTDDGAVTAVLSDASAIESPPVGAGPPRF